MDNTCKTDRCKRWAAEQLWPHAQARRPMLWHARCVSPTSKHVVDSAQFVHLDQLDVALTAVFVIVRTAAAAEWRTEAAATRTAARCCGVGVC
jgi:hypothetical protein